ncbi:hypothetical protein WOLCODRAFT_153876 [Wolfiporia cocos MD-104 SS10]|uniref:Uncharacterized protein n=1 Tax=Wolfiporia cocos (strain MD-104) TaxID=742152 RepID=A0A2H3JY40_WOLCO|nr:hypothetical protein WOLCODRAFT_153876 [Wolfiporia cocos MD-104 SS10]
MDAPLACRGADVVQTSSDHKLAAKNGQAQRTGWYDPPSLGIARRDPVACCLRGRMQRYLTTSSKLQTQDGARKRARLGEPIHPADLPCIRAHASLECRHCPQPLWLRTESSRRIPYCATVEGASRSAGALSPQSRTAYPRRSPVQAAEGRPLPASMRTDEWPGATDAETPPSPPCPP